MQVQIWVSHGCGVGMCGYNGYHLFCEVDYETRDEEEDSDDEGKIGEEK